MRAYTLTHLDDVALMRALVELVAQDRATTAALLAHIAEVDARRLYAPAGYPSMHAYCVGALRLSEDAAFKRIQAARAARGFPLLFEALADGRLHLTGLCLLAPHLTADNVDELVAAASHRRKSEIEVLLAQRVVSPDATRGEFSQLAPAQVEAAGPGSAALLSAAELAPGQVGETAPGVSRPALELAPAQVEAPPEPPPDPAVRYALYVTIDRDTHDKLRHAQALLSHALPSGDVAQVLDRALDALIGQLEKRKVGAATSPAGSPRASARRRHVPAHVRRAVWERDQGRCTFVGENGHRCEARRFLEFDHVDPVARGGRATVAGMRLRCRTHNQLEAERAFGAAFIRARREQARHARARAGADRPPGAAIRPPGAVIRPPGAVIRPPGAVIRPPGAAIRSPGAAIRSPGAAIRSPGATIRPLGLKALARAAPSDPPEEPEVQHRRDVASALRELGVRSHVARQAVEVADRLPGATLEERLRAALRCLAPGVARAAPASGAV
jgi:hypothetical protein